MPERKKAARSTERRASAALPRVGKGLETPPPPSPPAAPGPPSSDAAAQLAAFGAAVKLLHARQFREAREMFARALGGPERAVTQRAQAHIAVCDRRLAGDEVELRSADDFYNYGVALMNARNVAAARQHLETASRLAPGSDYIHYALGLAQALTGDLGAAYENLKRAIELEPRNRIIARQDADLAPLADRPPLDSLLYPERAGW